MGIPSKKIVARRHCPPRRLTQSCPKMPAEVFFPTYSLHPHDRRMLRREDARPTTASHRTRRSSGQRTVALLLSKRTCSDTYRDVVRHGKSLPKRHNGDDPDGSLDNDGLPFDGHARPSVRAWHAGRVLHRVPRPQDVRPVCAGLGSDERSVHKISAGNAAPLNASRACSIIAVRQFAMYSIKRIRK